MSNEAQKLSTRSEMFNTDRHGTVEFRIPPHLAPSWDRSARDIATALFSSIQVILISVTASSILT